MMPANHPGVAESRKNLEILEIFRIRALVWAAWNVLDLDVEVHPGHILGSTGARFRFQERLTLQKLF